MSWFLGCTDGMTAAEAARIGFGLGALAMGALAAAVLAREAWRAAGEAEEEERPTFNAQLPTLKSGGEKCEREELKLEGEAK